MSQPMKKGSFQYIKRRKRRQMLLSLGLFAIAFGLFLLGLLLNHFEKANVFTILAVLMMLPSSKMLISYIILVPFHSVSKERYDQVLETVEDGVNVWTDVVFTSSEKIMNLDFMVIDHHFIICYGTQKKNLSYIETYLKDTMKRNEYKYQVEVFEDYDRFLKRIQKLSFSEEQKDENYETMIHFLQTLMV